MFCRSLLSSYILHGSRLDSVLWCKQSLGNAEIQNGYSLLMLTQSCDLVTLGVSRELTRGFQLTANAIIVIIVQELGTCPSHKHRTTKHRKK